MVKLIKTTILINIIMLATGCSSMMQNSISFAIKGQNKSYIYKNTWPECANFKINSSLKYNDLSDSCKVSPEGYVPPQIIIEYAPWLTMEQVEKILGDYPQKALSDIVLGFATEKEKNEFKIWNIKQQELIEKIPATAWKRIVLTPPKDVEKYKYQVPEGKGNRSRGKNIHYIIYVNPDGSYDIEPKLYWVSKYQEKWN